MSQFDPKNLQRIPRKSKKKKPAAEAADDEALAEALSSKKNQRSHQQVAQMAHETQILSCSMLGKTCWNPRYSCDIMWFYVIYGSFFHFKNNEVEHLVAQEELEVMFLATP